jgi:Putative peptidoglycan binding domain/L,D-transpeptidase catalytic domain
VSAPTSRGTRVNIPKFVPIVAAVALVGVVGTVGAIGVITKGDASADGSGAPNAAAVAAGSSTLAPTTSTTLAPTTTLPPKTTIAGPLRRGMAGPEVQALQQRLQDVGFQPGPIDGQFGDLTRMAVWAYQKLVMGVPFDQPDGVVTPQMWLDLQDPLPVHARRPDAGFHTELYLPQQVVVVFDGDTPKFISHMSSGELAPPGNDFTKGQEWCEEVTIDPGENGNVDGTEPIKKGVCGNAWTPGGTYSFYRKVEGKRESRLGGMQNPVYFNYGIAIHGAYTVPLHPASHGCIRIPNAISPTFFNLVGLDQKVFVWDGVKEPEVYGAQSGLWDWNDPNYTTTTSTTTTTTTTTVAPTTIKPPTPTAAPPVATPAVTTTIPAGPPPTPPPG